MGKYCKNELCSESANGECTAWDECPFFEWDIDRRKETGGYPCPREEEEQSDLCKWCDENLVKLIHIPNERKCSVVQGARLRRQGVRKGFPDNFIVGASAGYNGLFIELKRRVKSLSRVSEEQNEWIDILNASGYKAVVCYGAEAAIKEIKKYFKEKKK